MYRPRPWPLMRKSKMPLPGKIVLLNSYFVLKVQLNQFKTEGVRAWHFFGAWFGPSCIYDGPNGPIKNSALGGFKWSIFHFWTKNLKKHLKILGLVFQPETGEVGGAGTWDWKHFFGSQGRCRYRKLQVDPPLVHCLFALLCFWSQARTLRSKPNFFQT